MGQDPRRAFTLIELLVVISIIAILAVMLMPALGMVRSQARSVHCSSNVRQLVMGAGAYSGDWRGCMVPAMSPGNGWAGHQYNYTGLLGPYLDSTAPEGQDFTSADQLRAAVCPESPRRFGYGHNYMYMGWMIVGYGGGYYRQSQVTRPSEKVYFCDSVMTDWGLTFYGFPLGTAHNFVCWQPYVRPGGYSAAIDMAPYFVHQGKATVAWVDGHVSTRTSNDGFWIEDALWEASPSNVYWRRD